MRTSEEKDPFNNNRTTSSEEQKYSSDTSQKISSFNELYQQDCYQWLCKIQAYYDDQVANKPTTRSPIHIMAFIVSFAAGNEQEKKAIIYNLFSQYKKKFYFPPSLPKEDSFIKQLNTLINDIAWEKIFDTNNNITISCTITVPYKKSFQKNLPDNLKNALLNNNYPIKIQGNNPGRIQIVTSLKQNSGWVHTWESSKCYPDYWELDHFILSDKLKSTINNTWLKKKIGNFTIIKGKKKYGIKLYLKKNQSNDSYAVQDSNDCTGIYESFKHLNNYAGCGNISNVIVKLQNTAQLSCQGIQASSMQETELMDECGVTNTKQPTEIFIEQPIILIDGIGMVVDFENSPSKNGNDPIYIRLMCHNTSVTFYPFRLSNKEAFLILSKPKETYNRKQKNSLNTNTKSINSYDRLSFTVNESDDTPKKEDSKKCYYTSKNFWCPIVTGLLFASGSIPFTTAFLSKQSILTHGQVIGMGIGVAFAGFAIGFFMERKWQKLTDQNILPTYMSCSTTSLSRSPT